VQALDRRRKLNPNQANDSRRDCPTGQPRRRKS
jgi:hypothetical protein